MSANQASQHAASSPPSAGSHTGYGTPSTDPTVMSPESGGATKNGNAAVPYLELDTAFDGPSPVNSSISFRRNGHAIAPVHITTPMFSPTAEEFTPIAHSLGMYHLSGDHGSSGQAGGGGIQVGSTHSASNHGAVGHTPAAFQQTNAASSAPLRVAPSHMVRVLHGSFSIDEPTSRAFVVTGCSLYCTDFQYIATSYKNFESLSNIDASLLNEGTFAVEFTDFNDAKQAAMLTLQFLFRDQPVKVFKLTPKDLAVKRGKREELVSNWQATYSVGVVCLDRGTGAMSTQELFETCQSVGAVKAFARIDAQQANPQIIAVFRVEWSDTKAQVGALNGAPFMTYRLIVQPFTPDVTFAVQKPCNDNPSRPAKAMQRLGDDEHAERVQSFLRQPRNGQAHVNSNHNVVDTERILRGLDVRTTIMLRNIPNRVNQDGLKMLLDQTSRGQYDFMYLRIDFANNCNVGYAFINFVDPMAIVPFASARAGQKWNLFNSDKVAEISYATIQGRDCLIQKFRNSSVMLERGSFRPKLYKTGNGADAGAEEPFPGPDNQAKLKRSCDNAEHVGLYIPPTRLSPYHVDVLPPPRNQTAGGSYVAPATTRRALLTKQPSLTPPPTQGSIFTYPGTSPKTSTSLYAPREGQAHRERQRRQQTQFDRGTPGAELQSHRSVPSVHSSGNLTTATSPDWNKPTSPFTPISLRNRTIHYLGIGNQDENARKLGLPPHRTGTEHSAVAEEPNPFIRRLLGCL